MSMRVGMHPQLDLSSEVPVTAGVDSDRVILSLLTAPHALQPERERGAMTGETGSCPTASSNLFFYSASRQKWTGLSRVPK